MPRLAQGRATSFQHFPFLIFTARIVSLSLRLPDDKRLEHGTLE